MLRPGHFGDRLGVSQGWGVGTGRVLLWGNLHLGSGSARGAHHEAAHRSTGSSAGPSAGWQSASSLGRISIHMLVHRTLWGWVGEVSVQALGGRGGSGGA